MIILLIIFLFFHFYFLIVEQVTHERFSTDGLLFLIVLMQGALKLPKL